MAAAEKSARSLGDLQAAGLLGAEVTPDLAAVAGRYAVSVTPGVLRAIRGGDPEGGVARQYLPSSEELQEFPAELDDPIGDGPHSPVKGVVHRYDDRVLLNLLKTCAVYCRFCFRREMVGPGARGLDSAELEAALDYIRGEERIWEVIFSGGDPLTLSARRIRAVLEELARIPHVGVARFHTRVPAVAPELVTEELLAALRAGPTAFVVLHVNHPDELTAEVRAAIARLADAGIPLLSQSVLLKGVNNSAEVLGRLFRALVQNRVKPYYLHHADLARGTGHFRTSIAEGQEIVDGLRQGHSGLCIPAYVLDLPGGAGKVPVARSWILGEAEGSYLLRDRHGAEHAYRDHAAAQQKRPDRG
ncbi:lysine-2,3-aminomutase-like protein [Mangrovicoccus sp. HB161399]|uniref:lysine-2,3-aminomutase-like protein n=1 Tax=Mangrovicoccus sp. HB161399 TaxID=2720392 RepID=UPI001553AA05|nr:lysine-2,3-aminomutase-like protein [Mangrovicoccus sp. HB161399]